MEAQRKGEKRNAYRAFSFEELPDPKKGFRKEAKRIVRFTENVFTHIMSGAASRH